MNPLTFLLIDDDRINNFLVDKQIRVIAPNTKVISYTDPIEACQYILDIKESEFRDLVIFLDINMPLLNGWELLEKVKEKYPEKLPNNSILCMLSSSDHSDDINKSSQFSIIEKYFFKPISISNIEEVITIISDN